MEKRRFALIGTGNRGTTMWGKELLGGWREHVDLVAIVDTNSLRAERARTMIGSNAPIYENIDAMLAEQQVDMVIVCTPIIPMTTSSCGRWRRASTSSPKSR